MRCTNFVPSARLPMMSGTPFTTVRPSATSRASMVLDLLDQALHLFARLELLEADEAEGVEELALLRGERLAELEARHVDAAVHGRETGCVLRPAHRLGNLGCRHRRHDLLLDAERGERALAASARRGLMPRTRIGIPSRKRHEARRFSRSGRRGRRLRDVGRHLVGRREPQDEASFTLTARRRADEHAVGRERAGSRA